MALRFEDGWHIGESADDLTEFLHDHGAEGYPVHEVRHSVCDTCAGGVFVVQGLADEQAVKRVCKGCGAEHYIADSRDYWCDEDSHISVCTCEAEEFNVAVGYSLYGPEMGGIRSVATAELCVACGRIGSLAEWMLRTGDTSLLDRR